MLSQVRLLPLAEITQRQWSLTNLFYLSIRLVWFARVTWVDLVYEFGRVFF
jgi:hypothetical protein